MQDLVTRLLHRLDPETAHRVALAGLRWGLSPGAAETEADPILRQSLWGLDFRHPVGLAAGFDKSAVAPRALAKLGFAFVEIGTVTPRPQAGNPRPRLFRLPGDRAVINRMGFNNDGHQAVRARLAALGRPSGQPSDPLGINLGANKDSADRIADYEAGMAALAGLADYVVINVSSPNTPGLRELQAADALDTLLARVLAARDGGTPVLVKLAPDLAEADLADIAEVVLARGIDGAILTNTTIGGRDRLADPLAQETGGLSGAPLFELSTRVLAQFHRLTQGRLPLIGVGGIEDAETAYAKIRAGASLVQLYTGFLYRGPGLIAEVRDGLAQRLRASTALSSACSERGISSSPTLKQQTCTRIITSPSARRW